MRIKILILLIPIMVMCFGGNMLYAADAEEQDTENVFTLGEVIVTAEQSVVDLATTITELSAQDISARGDLTVAEALEFLPGVDVQKGGKSQMFVSIRGFEQDDVKVLIDGVPAHESYDGTVDLSMIPTEAISKITVAKGASSVLYGANTMGGVINIITKKGGKEPATEVTASFGNDGAAKYTFNHGGTAGVLNYWLTYGYSESDGFRLSDDFNPADPVVGLGTDYNEDGGTRDLSDYIKRTLNAKVGYEPDEDSRIYFSFDYHNNERGIPSGRDRYWAFTKWDQWQLNLVGEHVFDDIFRAKARVFYVNHDDTITDVSWDADHTTGRKWFETSSYDDDSRGAELHGFFDLERWGNLRIGLNYLRDNHRQQDFYDAETMSVWRFGEPEGFQPEEEYTADTYTLAVEDEIEPAENLAVVFGLSYNTFEPVRAYDRPVPDKMSSLNPQIGLVYDVNYKTSIHASVGKKTRFPQLKELYSDLAGGNPDLDPQKTVSYEIGAYHEFNGMFRGNIAFFYNDISDLIDQVEDQATGEDIYVNLYEANIEGIEAELDMDFSCGLLARFNYTYMTTEDKSNQGGELEGRPEHRINLDLRYGFPFGLTTNVQTSYATGAYWEGPDYNWVELPHIFLIDAKITQDLGDIFNLDSELFVQVDNLTDYDYYQSNGPEPGRNFMTGLAIKF
jgi:outer membrane receptor protein involved in Fe transport